MQNHSSGDRLALGILFLFPHLLGSWSYNATTGSSYLIFLYLYSPSRSLRSSSDTLQHFSCKTHGLHTFSHLSPHIWNNYPQDIRLKDVKTLFTCIILSSFKSKLRTFLFPQYFNYTTLSFTHDSLYNVCVCVCVCVCASCTELCLNPCWCLHYMFKC